MAQALFDDHPLEAYLRSAGEAPEFMPGSSPELELELNPLLHMEFDEGGQDESEQNEELDWRPLFLIQLTEMFLAVISTLSTSNQTRTSPFAERFKYDVISSSLLAVSLSSVHGRNLRPSIPGQLNHSRTPSMEIQHPITPHNNSSDSSYSISLSVLIVIFFTAGYTLFAFITLGIAVYISRAINDSPKHDISPVLESLNDVIASSCEWESVVQEAITALEHDQQTTSYASSPSSPSSSLRLALQSSLHTTETQCDNIRHLFSALTSPSELAQLSEMYAPPSPMKPAFLSQESNKRPLSLPARRRTLSMPPGPSDPHGKRSTWSGYHDKAGPATSPTQMLRRREKRRSDLSSILSISPPLITASAPVSPMHNTISDQSLPLVNEDGEEDENTVDDTQELTFGTQELNFGAAALELHRSRKRAGIEALKTPPPSYTTVLSPKPYNAALSPSSKYTTIQSPRHHLSLTGLNHAVRGAMAAKRYACAHLLALRFSDEEDEGYWEDVRSVMGLLTSTLVDASSRLSQALEYAEREKLRDQNPTPSSPMVSFQISEEEEGYRHSQGSPRPKKDRRRSSLISFAPVPSHLSRFAAHVEAITTALDDAREHLQECVTSLHQEPDSTTTKLTSKHRSRPAPHASFSDMEEEESQPLQAYERLRRELGLALRECERGRERLLDIVYPPHLGEEEDEDSTDDLPGLGHDASDDSDKPDPTSPFEEEVEQEGIDAYAVVVQGAESALDDATSHLLLTASTQHLPPPGVEQVFEADTGGAMPFSREKSKLTREERIKLMKDRRESGGGGILGVGLGRDPVTTPERGRREVEKWGPGGDVVQELKDVIWKVGEKRRKMNGGSPLDHHNPPSVEVA